MILYQAQLETLQIRSRSLLATNLHNTAVTLILFVHEDAEAVSPSKAFQKTTLSSSLQHGPGLWALSVLGGEDIAVVALAATERQTRDLSQSF